MTTKGVLVNSAPSTPGPEYLAAWAAGLEIGTEATGDQRLGIETSGSCLTEKLLLSTIIIIYLKKFIYPHCSFFQVGGLGVLTISSDHGIRVFFLARRSMGTRVPMPHYHLRPSNSFIETSLHDLNTVDGRSGEIEGISDVDRDAVTEDSLDNEDESNSVVRHSEFFYSNLLFHYSADIR